MSQHITSFSDDDTATAKALAQLMGVTERHVRRLANDGLIERAEGRGRFKLRQALRAYTRTLQETSTSSSATTADYADERARLTREQRIGQQIKNAQLAGEWAPISLLETTLSRVCADIVQHLEGARPQMRRLADGLYEKYRDAKLERDIRSLIDEAEDKLLAAMCAASNAKVDADSGIPSGSE